MLAEKRYTLRPFQPADRARVCELCCETGFLGNPIDPIFEDREIFTRRNLFPHVQATLRAPAQARGTR